MDHSFFICYIHLLGCCLISRIPMFTSHSEDGCKEIDLDLDLCSLVLLISEGPTDPLCTLLNYFCLVNLTTITYFYFGKIYNNKISLSLEKFSSGFMTPTCLFTYLPSTTFGPKSNSPVKGIRSSPPTLFGTLRPNLNLYSRLKYNRIDDKLNYLYVCLSVSLLISVHVY